MSLFFLLAGRVQKTQNKEKMAPGKKKDELFSVNSNLGGNYGNVEDEDEVDEFEDEDEPPTNILESLNIYPKVSNPCVGTGEVPVSSTGGASETSLSMTSRTTSSPSAGIRSEMEYVVQKIAALARATSTDPTATSPPSTTDSNANLRFGSPIN